MQTNKVLQVPSHSSSSASSPGPNPPLTLATPRPPRAHQPATPTTPGHCRALKSDRRDLIESLHYISGHRAIRLQNESPFNFPPPPPPSRSASHFGIVLSPDSVWSGSSDLEAIIPGPAILFKHLAIHCRRSTHRNY